MKKLLENDDGDASDFILDARPSLCKVLTVAEIDALSDTSAISLTPTRSSLFPLLLTRLSFNWSETMCATPQLKAQQQKLILIVDDTPTNIGVISGALKDSYKTKVATNGAKALAIAAEEEKPDLILLDVMMPEMDGYEVCSRLKADSTTAEIPIIFLTGQTSPEDETKGFDVGAVDYVHKPFSPAVVKARVRSHILLREARAQLAKQLLDINAEFEMARRSSCPSFRTRSPSSRDSTLPLASCP